MSTEQRLDRIESILERIALLMQVQLPASAGSSQEPSHKSIVGPEEAARILGIPITTGKTHTRRLKYFREHGFLTKFTGTSPYYYNVAELKQLAQRLADGQVAMPHV